MQPSSGNPSSPSIVTATKKCYLLNLPAELRICIYELALETGRTLWTHAYSNPSTGITFHSRRFGNEPALTRACNQTRREALPLHYALNTFGFIITANSDRMYATVSLGRMGRFIQHVRKVNIILLCKHTIFYSVDFVRGVSTYNVGGGNKECCTYQLRNLREAQALIESLVADRGEGAGWSEAEVMSVIDLLRAGHENVGASL